MVSERSNALVFTPRGFIHVRISDPTVIKLMGDIRLSESLKMGGTIPLSIVKKGDPSKKREVQMQDMLLPVEDYDRIMEEIAEAKGKLIE